MKRGFLLRAEENKTNTAKVSSPASGPQKIQPQVTTHELGRSTAPSVTENRLSSGKLTDAEKALPKDHKHSEPQWIVSDNGSVNTDPGNWTITCLPQPEDGYGRCEWIVSSGKAKATVLQTPGYPAPVPSAHRSITAVVKQTPDMGVGLFAACDIGTGELVFAERPLLVVPAGVPMSATKYPHLTPEQKRQAAMIDYEKILQLALSRMPVEKQKAFMSLANSHTEDGSGPIIGIIRTNGYGLSIPDGKESTGENYTVVGELGSRINHSCRPNVQQTFDFASFSLQFHASRDIKSGEQILYHYCVVTTSAAKRRALLAPYGIVCQCLSCVNASPESDQLRLGAPKIVLKMSQLGLAIWQGKQQADPAFIKILLDLEKDMIQEGINGCEIFYILLTVIAGTFKSMGDIQQQAVYLARCPASLIDLEETLKWLESTAS